MSNLPQSSLRDDQLYRIKPIKKVWFAAVLITLVLGSLTCQRQVENPEIIGDTSWLDKNSPEQREYLLGLFQDKGDTNTVISWPPDTLRRTIDISVDVTGSGYQRESLYQGTRMPLAEHNVRKFIEERLLNELRAGDKIVMRIYGSMPGGKRVAVDEKTTINFVQDQVSLYVTNPSRRRGHVQIIVRKVERAALETRRSFTDQVLNWFTVFLKRASQQNEKFEASPLLQHVRTICKEYSSNTEPIWLVFITDGHFHLGNLYYSPTTYSLSSCAPDKVQKKV